MSAVGVIILIIILIGLGIGGFFLYKYVNDCSRKDGSAMHIASYMTDKTGNCVANLCMSNYGIDSNWTPDANGKCPVYTPGPSYTKSEPAHDCRLPNGSYNNGLPNPSGAKSQSECQAACDANINCKAYETKDGDPTGCWLFSSGVQVTSITPTDGEENHFCYMKNT